VRSQKGRNTGKVSFSAHFSIFSDFRRIKSRILHREKVLEELRLLEESAGRAKL